MRIAVIGAGGVGCWLAPGCGRPAGTSTSSRAARTWAPIQQHGLALASPGGNAERIARVVGDGRVAVGSPSSPRRSRRRGW
jgi:hypothetical protein